MLDGLEDDTFKITLLQAVAAEDFDSVPDDLNDHARFAISCARVAGRRQAVSGFVVFVYSEAAGPEGKPLGFQRIAHMQEGHGVISNSLILTNRDVNNGMRRDLAVVTPEGAMEEIEAAGFGSRCTFVWDAANRMATIYPDGVENDTNFVKMMIATTQGTLTQDDVCAALDATYNDNLKNPSAHTAHLWVKGKLIESAEDEIERHLKGQLSMWFAGRQRAIKVISQTNNNAGRTDLVFLERQGMTGPVMAGVLELKVLRGPPAADSEVTGQGLSQGHYYKRELGLPFATLALYDVNSTPSANPAPLLVGQNKTHIACVRVKRYPIYNSPDSWRRAGGYEAA
jgi:hypothetical protein